MKIREAKLKDYDQIMFLYQQLQPDDPVVEEFRGKSVFKSIVESINYILRALRIMKFSTQQVF